MIKTFAWSNGKRRCFFLMKWATAHPTRAFFRELRVWLNNPYQVGAVFQIINKELVVEH
jgi:hypothetical protein